MLTVPRLWKTSDQGPTRVSTTHRRHHTYPQSDSYLYLSMCTSNNKYSGPRTVTGQHVAWAALRVMIRTTITDAYPMVCLTTLAQHTEG